MRVLSFIRETTKPYRAYLWCMLGIIIFVSIDSNVKPYLVKLLINTATGDAAYNVWNIIGIYAVFQFLLVFAWSFSDWCNTRFNPKYQENIISNLVNTIGEYHYSFFQNNLAGSISSRINDVSSTIPAIVITFNYQFVKFFITTLITMVMLFMVNYIFGLGLLLWIAVFIGANYVIMKRVAVLAQDFAEARATIWGQVSDYIINVLNVRLFATSKFERGRLAQNTHNYVKKYQTAGYYMMNFYIFQGIITSVYAMAFVVGLVYLKTQNLITAGDFALVFMLNFKAFDNLFEFSHQLREFTTMVGNASQALTMLSDVPEIQDKPDAAILKVSAGQIIFKNVNFQYKDNNILFADKSIGIEPGQKVGLVGYSGGGKTTFVNLILRLYDINSGSINIDGQDIKDVTQDSLHEAIGMIPQDPSLFHRSLMDNIRYGRIDATDAEVIAAAKSAHAHEFIIKLANGYESLVGERGIKLSGGQRQRIAIARAILKNAPILILDEATSQLDSITEQQIQDSLWRLMQNKTSIVVAHRLSTLLKMDRILVFAEGKIIEDGGHQQLLAQDGLYKTLWDAQVGGFIAL